MDLAAATRPAFAIRTDPLTDSSATSPLMSFTLTLPEMELADTRVPSGAVRLYETDTSKLRRPWRRPSWSCG
jgi:hypothetical protein